MGEVITDKGNISMVEVEGRVSLQDLYQDITCTDYTDSYRARCIEACGKVGRGAWGVLNTLHELARSTVPKLSEAAEAALRKVDPGMPLLRKDMVVDTHTRNKKMVPVTANGVTTYKKPERMQVTVSDVPGDIHEHARIYATCSFCEKTAIFPKNLMKCNEVVAGQESQSKKRLFCSFCLRNEFYKLKHSKNILVLSYRGIIGYYYYCFNFVPKSSSMILSDIQQYTELHVKMGVQNPLFRYDPETMCWFVDFSKVGQRSNQMPINYILETAMEILASFNLYEHIREVSAATIYSKFKDAIIDFHHHRRRPAGQRLLVPTLFGCGIPMETALSKAIPIQALKNFTPSKMMENIKNGKKFG